MRQNRVGLNRRRTGWDKSRSWFPNECPPLSQLTQCEISHSLNFWAHTLIHPPKHCCRPSTSPPWQQHSLMAGASPLQDKPTTQHRVQTPQIPVWSRICGVIWNKPDPWSWFSVFDLRDSSTPGRLSQDLTFGFHQVGEYFLSSDRFPPQMQNFTWIILLLFWSPR